MKLVVALVCAVLAVSAVYADTADDIMKNMGGYSEEQIKLYMESRAICIPESGVDIHVVEEAEKGNVSIDEKLACFGACMLKRFGVMREDGSIDDEAALKQIPPAVNQERAIEVFNKCKKVRSKNHCVKAGLIGRCILSKKDYVLTGKA